MTLTNFLFGNLTLQDLPFLFNPIVKGTGIAVTIIGIAVLFAITYFKKWGYLFREWVISVDHKKIGIMYVVLAVIMLLRGFADAVMMRAQQALSVGHSMGYLPPEHFNQVFTAHGVIMIFFMAMPLMFGLINMVLPIQIGARDVAYPYLNSLSFWLTGLSAMLVMASLFIGKFAATGWLAYPPLSGIVYSPGVGVDYYIWAIQISGIGSLLSAVNFTATILKMRCPGMTLMKMPIFVWTVLCSMILVILAFPILTATLGMLFLDRFFGMHFFTAGFGGSAMMYVNLIWSWGHPEVYILVLPAFGIFSEVVSTFCKKPLFGYKSMVYATFAITFLSFIVWLHHFFTMGAGANVNAFFGIATMIIAVPTGLKIFNWLFTMFRGRIHFTTPMLWTMGFITTFTIGGMTGVMLAVPGIDFQMHNSVFLVAHFHNVIIGGVVFGYFAGLIYWFPKTFGFKLNERLGKCAFWCWLVGFYVAFMPLYVLGLKGMTRRLQHYSASSGFHPWLVVAAIGAGIIFIGICFQLLMLFVSIRDQKKQGTIVGNDPWDGRTLEWSIPSPPQFYNFAVTPHADERDAFWEEKQRGGKAKPVYTDIHMPKDTATGFIAGVFSFIFAFGMIWHIQWMIALGLAGAAITVIARTFNKSIDYHISAAEVEEMEKARAKRDAELGRDKADSLVGAAS